MASVDRPPLFISTAIPYVNARPHIGFAFEIVLTDVVARYHRARGRDVFFLTGTDDNSLKNVQAAQKAGIPIEELVENNARHFHALKDTLGLSFDDFLRTSGDPRHQEAVRKLWKACAGNGDIYLGEYSGLYCVGCEQFYAPEELLDGLCPEHLVPPDEVREENYFFRLSRYQDDLLRLIENGSLRIVPESRRAEIKSFIEGGLQDISISRSTERAHGWGLPVPGDDEHVIYVWFDALTNYISALGYGTEGSLYRRYWSENSTRIHVIGKGILRFHAAYWPAMLLSARVELPSAIFVHGYLTAGGKKISKSLGHLTNPGELSAQIGADALRYYLLSQFRAADDGDFSVEQLRLVRDNDLADQLGNLVSRVAAMIGRYRDGRIPAPNSADDPITRSAESLLRDVDRAVESFEIDRALRRVWELVREANRHVVEQEPWVLSKETSSASQEGLSTVLYNLAEVLRIVAVFSSPFIPSAAREIAKILGLPAGWERISEASAEWGGTRPGTELAPARALFPKDNASDLNRVSAS
jgi:methionyl-tRNA synthetase